MKDMMEYKDYAGSVHFNAEDEVFYGKIEYIRDLVSYEGHDAKSIRAAFEEAVDDYLALHAERGTLADQPFKGSFNVRPGSELHRKAAIYAREHDVNLNHVVVQALEKFLEQRL